VDLRNGKKTWKIQTALFGDELKIEIDIVRYTGDMSQDYYSSFFKKVMVFDCHVSIETNSYMTVIKGVSGHQKVRLELYGDNIHYHRINELNPKYLDYFRSVNVYGFIKFNEQGKIPIAICYECHDIPSIYKKKE